jgi:hypothetical protein
MKILRVLAMIVLLVSGATAQTTHTNTGGKAGPVGGYIRFGNAAGVPPTIGFSGDLSGTSTSQTVVGILGQPLPPTLPGPPGGYLHWNGTAWVFDTPSGGGGGGIGITINGATPSPSPANFNDGFPPPPPFGYNVQWKLNGNQISAALVGDGEPTHCLLGNGQFAPCPSSTGGGGGSMTWPAGGAGIPNYSGASSWNTSYSAGNQIPSSFIPTLNQNTTGTAGTATALASTPTTCTTGNAPVGILANGNATGCAPIGGGGGGSGTVNSGTANQVAYYATTGTAVSGDSRLTDDGSTLTYSGAGGVSSGSYTGTGPAFTITTTDQSSTPTAPASGSTVSYSKGGLWCSNSSSGGEKCTGGTGGGGGTTRTWSYAFQGVCQGGVASVPVNFPLTNSPSYVACDATHITPEWQMPAGNTTDTFWVRLTVPTGHTGVYTLTTRFRSLATSGSATLQPSVACVDPASSGSPDNPTFSPIGSTIALTPNATNANWNVVATGTFTPTCADGAVLYVMYTFTANTLASPLNFSYVSLAVTGTI